jgi:hypothetical protein
MTTSIQDRMAGDDRRRQHGAVEHLIRRICRICPERASGRRQERRAQILLRRALQPMGGTARWHRFRFNRSLYAVIALHFGLAVLATALMAVHPVIAGLAHSLLAVSYVADSQRWAYLLRRLFRFHFSQNLVVTFAARKNMRQRVVVIAHADAAPTGWLFHPRLASLGGRCLSLVSAVFGQAVVVRRIGARRGGGDGNRHGAYWDSVAALSCSVCRLQPIFRGSRNLEPANRMAAQNRARR